MGVIRMSQWNPANIAALCTALAAVITAIGAAIHSMNTRKGVAENEVANMEKGTETKNNSTGT